MAAPSPPISPRDRPAPLPFKAAGWWLGLLFVGAAASQVKLQVFEARGTVALGERTNRYTRIQTDPAKRGSILTSDGKILAEDTGSFELTLLYPKLPNVPAFYVELAAASGIPAPELAPPTPETAQRSWPGPIPASAVARIRAVGKRWRADGVSLRAIGLRSYPMAEITSCLVGVQREMATKGKDGLTHVGTMRTGLERSMADHLAGHDGRETGLADRNGVLLPLRTNNDRIERRDGEDIVTTLDSPLQEIAAKAIRKAVIENRAENGVAIVLNPKNGDVLAMANWPSFNPIVTGDGQGVGYNPAFMAVLEPGSTFKILTLAKALDDDKTTMDSWVQCAGELRLNKFWRVRCDSHHGNRAHGPTDPLKAIAKSCNVAAATWALRIGREPFLKYMDDLGLLDRSHLGVPGELRGKYNKKEYAQPLQLANFGFGQSMSVTPVSLAGAFATLANGGERREPRLLRRIGDRDIPLAPGRRILGAKACDQTIRAMTAVIETDAGTGAKLRIPGYSLAGKTGTAQKIGKGQSGYVASFVGFVPAKKPEAVILVMVNHPMGEAYYGAPVAGPVFRTLALGVIERLRIPKDAPEGVSLTGPAVTVTARTLPQPKPPRKKPGVRSPQ